MYIRGHFWLFFNSNGKALWNQYSRWKRKLFEDSNDSSFYLKRLKDLAFDICFYDTFVFYIKALWPQLRPAAYVKTVAIVLIGTTHILVYALSYSLDDFVKTVSNRKVVLSFCDI